VLLEHLAVTAPLELLDLQDKRVPLVDLDLMELLVQLVEQDKLVPQVSLDKLVLLAGMDKLVLLEELV
jgi:hypothetical protein